MVWLFTEYVEQYWAWKEKALRDFLEILSRVCGRGLCSQGSCLVQRNAQVWLLSKNCIEDAFGLLEKCAQQWSIS